MSVFNIGKKDDRAMTGRLHFGHVAAERPISALEQGVQEARKWTPATLGMQADRLLGWEVVRQ